MVSIRRETCHIYVFALLLQNWFVVSSLADATVPAISRSLNFSNFCSLHQIMPPKKRVKLASADDLATGAAAIVKQPAVSIRNWHTLTVLAWGWDVVQAGLGVGAGAWGLGRGEAGPGRGSWVGV